MSPEEFPLDDNFEAKVHRDATALCGEIVGYFHGEKPHVNENIFVPLILFSRVIRLRDAALTLTRAGFPTEAGIIVLSQFEAKLDLVQAATDPKWATRWVEHQDTRQSATPKIARAIEAIFEDEDERMVEQSIFRHLSAMKHGNPASSELGFQVRKAKGTIAISTGDMDDAVTGVANTMIGGYATCQLAWASQILGATTGQYAICMQSTRQAVYENWRKVSGFGKVFAQFLASLIEGRAGHLDLASARRRN
jgi:hypothetical protein